MKTQSDIDVGNCAANLWQRVLDSCLALCCENNKLNNLNCNNCNLFGSYAVNVFVHKPLLAPGSQPEKLDKFVSES